jgi:hypothetical protein
LKGEKLKKRIDSDMPKTSCLKEKHPNFKAGCHKNQTSFLSDDDL